MISSFSKKGQMAMPSLELKVYITNCSQKDAKFLQTLISLFTDPEYALLADKIRSGIFGVQYYPNDGSPLVVDLRGEALPQSAPASAKDLINFFAIFTKEEWDKLKEHRKEILARYRANRFDGLALVNQLLGYVPKSRPPIFIGNE
jgi:hypothetical protein